ncbi:MAG: hypothetical protein GEU28_03045 [Dehalococcoidia bacterium]|nr:hypothetical protein [Dehalococcoidia bacterium]
MSPRPLTLTLLLALGGALASFLLMGLVSGTGDRQIVRDREPREAATAEPTPIPTLSPTESLTRDFQPAGCALQSLNDGWNEWLPGADARADRIEVLGGIGFWREVVAGVLPLVDAIPETRPILRLHGESYLQAFDEYLASLGEFWFTAQPETGQVVSERLTALLGQRDALQAAIREEAGGPISLQCSDPL